MDIYKKVREIVMDRFDKEEDDITPETSFQDTLQADSLDLVELIMALEEEFHLEVPDEEIKKIQTVGDIVDYIKENT